MVKAYVHVLYILTIEVTRYSYLLGFVLTHNLAQLTNCNIKPQNNIISSFWSISSYLAQCTKRAIRIHRVGNMQIRTLRKVSIESYLVQPRKTVLQETFKPCKYFSCKTCKILHALNLASLTLKMKFFLQDIKMLHESCKKSYKIILLQDLDQTLQENYLTFFLHNLARFSYLERKLHF